MFTRYSFVSPGLQRMSLYLRKVLWYKRFKVLFFSFFLNGTLRQTILCFVNAVIVTWNLVFHSSPSKSWIGYLGAEFFHSTSQALWMIFVVLVANEWDCVVVQTDFWYLFRWWHPENNNKCATFRIFLMIFFFFFLRDFIHKKLKH